MNRIDRTAMLAPLLTNQGLAAMIPHFRLFEDSVHDHQGNIRATIEIGYVGAKGRFKLTAVHNVPSLDDALQQVVNGNHRSSFASTIDMAVRAMPAASRPDLPGWVAELSQAKRIEADRARVRGMAVAAASAAV